MLGTQDGGFVCIDGNNVGLPLGTFVGQDVGFPLCFTVGDCVGIMEHSCLAV
jgi:hypothetical protein